MRVGYVRRPSPPIAQSCGMLALQDIGIAKRCRVDALKIRQRISAAAKESKIRKKKEVIEVVFFRGCLKNRQRNARRPKERRNPSAVPMRCQWDEQRAFHSPPMDGRSDIAAPCFSVSL